MSLDIVFDLLRCVEKAQTFINVRFWLILTDPDCVLGDLNNQLSYAAVPRVNTHSISLNRETSLQVFHELNLLLIYILPTCNPSAVNQGYAAALLLKYWCICSYSAELLTGKRIVASPTCRICHLRSNLPGAGAPDFSNECEMTPWLV